MPLLSHLLLCADCGAGSQVHPLLSQGQPLVLDA